MVVGHICADILADGTAVLGGTALYSALAAASLGWRTGILTRGRYGFPINGLQIPPLAIGDDRIQIVVQDAEWPTCFVNEYDATGRRTQQIKRWAGQIDLSGMPPSWRTARVIHFGPIAQEIDVRQSTGVNPGFLGITPQGWMRDWPRATGGRVQAIHLRLPAEFVSQVDGIVVNDEEYVTSREIVDAIGKTGYCSRHGGRGWRRFDLSRRSRLGARIQSPGGRSDRRGRRLFGGVLLPDRRQIDLSHRSPAIRQCRGRVDDRRHRDHEDPDQARDQTADRSGRQQRLRR